MNHLIILSFGVSSLFIFFFQVFGRVKCSFYPVSLVHGFRSRSEFSRQSAATAIAGGGTAAPLPSRLTSWPPGRRGGKGPNILNYKNPRAGL